MCFCGHRFKEHEYMMPKNKKVQLFNYNRLFVKISSAVALRSITFPFLDPKI